MEDFFLAGISLTMPKLLVCIGLIVLAYFIGNINPAICLGKAYGINIKEVGSGNAGTTNVLRVLGKKAAVETLAIDILKGVIAVMLGALGAYIIADIKLILVMKLLCGLAVFCGHIWPVIFQFKGGKGVATAFGVLLAVYPGLALTELLLVGVVVLVTRKVSAGSLLAALILPFLAWYIFRISEIQNLYMCWTVVMAAIVIFKHRMNIVRLAKGEESNISFKK